MNQRVLAFILTVGFMLASLPVCAQDTLVFSAVEGTRPAVVAGEVLRRAYKQLGIGVEIRELPGERALMYSHEGKTDGEAFRISGIENEYPKLLRIDVPLRVDRIYLFVKRGKEFAVQGWGSIPAGTIIGYQRGVKFVEINTVKYGLKTLGVGRSVQLFRMLDAGRVDAIVEGPAKGAKVVKELGLQEIARLEPPIHTSVLYHYLHEKHAHLVPKITAVLKEMKASGELRMIQEQIDATERQ